MISWLFTSVQKLLQISIFCFGSYRECSPVFARVGVKLVSGLRRLRPEEAPHTAYRTLSRTGRSQRVKANTLRGGSLC
jgi:hypothetical protein